MKKCSRRNCSNIGTNRASYRQYYCNKHMRVRQMTLDSNYRYPNKIKLTFQYVENIFNKQMESGIMCPTCNRKMSLLRKNGSNNLVTIQHWENGNISFICMRCNSIARDGEWRLYIGKDNKVCTCCKKVLNKTNFHNNKTAYDGLNAGCKNCESIRAKIRHFKKKSLKVEDN